VPGGNLFIANQDLSTEPGPDGERAIRCTAISTPHGVRTASSGLRLLLRLLTLTGE
jgi:hypothetical protein